MNELFLNLGIERLKPLATAMLLPPMPFFLATFVALAAIRRQRHWGSAALVVSFAALWLSGCLGAANALAPVLLQLAPPLTAARIAELRRHAADPVAIIVLGAGVEQWAPEYRSSSLQFRSLERLRYGIWLGRKTGWPTGFSGGVGWGQPADEASAAEATVAQRIAADEFERPLRWIESTSRDTRENAINTVALLRSQGIRRIVIVTHAWHMPRALRNFERAALGASIRMEAAPIGLSAENEAGWMRWIPSGDGLTQMRLIVHEWVGMLSGA